ncbi:hypothetical protein PYCCODRAFT_1480977 [Trametes coccinea BRFM310]|uniref:Uncharacterized protein n=1 Tax=Trametes coccinea (strain BRFM310) TaxID=1353009 RepID=A0A1Y2I9Z6_TRAC3|nr:hypothetical protein PYCCODRAFT_1480977 [Trametes coccinea BRFM310]
MGRTEACAVQERQPELPHPLPPSFSKLTPSSLAGPRDVLAFYRSRKDTIRTWKVKIDAPELKIDDPELSIGEKLQLLRKGGMSEAIEVFVEKDDIYAHHPDGSSKTSNDDCDESVRSMLMDVDAGGSDFDGAMSDEPPPAKTKSRAGPPSRRKLRWARRLLHEGRTKPPRSRYSTKKTKTMTMTTRSRTRRLHQLNAYNCTAVLSQTSKKVLAKKTNAIKTSATASGPKRRVAGRLSWITTAAVSATQERRCSPTTRAEASMDRAACSPCALMPRQICAHSGRICGGTIPVSDIDTVTCKCRSAGGMLSRCVRMEHARAGVRKRGRGRVIAAGVHAVHDSVAPWV